MSDVVVATVDGVRSITFQRPARKNALTVQMYEEASAALESGSADPAVRVILVTGSGDSFTAGNDVADFMNTPPTGADSPVFRFLLALVRCEKPIVMAVNGTAVGIGVTMLLHADIVYVADTASLKMPFTSLGLCAEGASSLLLPRMAGHARAAELLLFGEAFDARTAVETGIAARVVPAAELLSFATARARILSLERPSVSLRITKRLMKDTLRADIEKALVAEAQEFMTLLSGPAAREAFTAFFEKRKPDFAALEEQGTKT
jgi:enoyl-CoA hydratase/carnithine racemase